MRSLSGASLALVAMLALATAGCSKVGELKSMKAFKGANQAYQQQDYKKASAMYEEAVASAPESRPAHQSYFSSATATTTCTSRARKARPRTMRS
jgi:hypothetical protein